MQGSGFLSTVLGRRRAELAARAGERAAWEKRAASAPPPPSFAVALSGARVAVIAEVKRRAPSAGGIRPDADALALARSYESAGAAAVSVLTEPEHFGGSLDDLSAVAGGCAVPVLRKDFLVSEVQLLEARACGAAAVLLIARALEQATLARLAGLARDLGLGRLVEVHDPVELDRALEVEPSAIGINARDLETLAIDPMRHELLLPRVPRGIPAVAESGLAGRADVMRVAGFGADAVLVGRAVAGATDVVTAVRELVGVNRVMRDE